MNQRILFHFGAVGLVLGAAVAITAASDGIALAGSVDGAKASKQAADLGRKATKALTRRDAAAAIGLAESAVALQPQNASYRALLGQAYLGAGRFTSAQQALGDALQVDPTLGKAALSLALAQIATGDWSNARRTLDAHVATIPVADRGLATALAGDPQSAVQILMDAARTPGADAKTRQNLALALALAGQWQQSKMVASADLSPEEVDQRMQQWASFAHPASASDQVASLLGVQPVADGGQPVALALNPDRHPTALAAQSTVPVDAYMPGQQVGQQVGQQLGQAAAAPVAPVVAAAPAPAMPVPEAAPYVDPQQAPRPQLASVTFGPPREIVQQIPARYLVQASEQRLAAAARPVVAGKGKYVVQLGAYRNARVARVAWAAMARSHPVIRAHAPSGGAITAHGVSYFRLSVAGFARGEANALCASVKAGGGRCFVRAGAGDRVASWGKGPQLAMR
jgi:Flp pilus assembly protein TadD